MEDITVTGIVLNSIKYGEKDKIIHIFSVELGNISATLKGVEAPKSKMKFAGQPFCFARFDLAEGHNFYVVKSVDLVDSFFDISLDYDAFILCNSMLEICNHILKPNILAERLFLSLLKTLQNIVYNKIDAKLAVLKFYCDLLENIGYGLNFEKCDNCGMKFLGDIKFDILSGTFRCTNCSGGIKVEKRDFMTLKIVYGTDIDRLHTLKLDDIVVQNLLTLVMEDVTKQTGFKFKTGKF